MGMGITLVTGLGCSHLGTMGLGPRPTGFVSALSPRSARRSAWLGGSDIPYTLGFLSLRSLSNHSAGQNQPVEAGRAQMTF